MDHADKEACEVISTKNLNYAHAAQPCTCRGSFGGVLQQSLSMSSSSWMVVGTSGIDSSFSPISSSLRRLMNSESVG